MFDSLSTEELEFVKAIERYKARTGKMFPAWTEILQILKELGYRKTSAGRSQTDAERAQRVPSQTGSS